MAFILLKQSKRKRKRHSAWEHIKKKKRHYGNQNVICFTLLIRALEVTLLKYRKKGPLNLGSPSVTKYFLLAGKFGWLQFGGYILKLLFT